MNLDGRRALVTGASRHLGSAIARSLASHGARVAVNHRDSKEEAARVADSLDGSSGSEPIVVAGDVSDPHQVEAMIGEVSRRFGGLDILVNNAGPYGATPLERVGRMEWDTVVDVNLKGAWLCSRAAAPLMERDGWGRVINISAVSGHVRNRGAYGFSKAAVEVLTEQLALEMGEYATVNAIAPGQVGESLDELTGIDPAWALEVTARTPRNRLVRRDEVGEIVVMLCSEAAASLTATTIHMDGGLRLNRF